MEKLHELHDEGGFDLIVVDTPPTRHALDFLDAPKRLTRLLDNRIFRLLMMPTRARTCRSRASRCRRSCAPSRASSGRRSIDDVVAFFRAFEGMEEGFRDARPGRRRAARRPAHRVRARHLAAARRDARRRRSSPTGSRRPARRCRRSIVNRVHPSFGDESPAGLRAAAERAAARPRPTTRTRGSPRSTTTSPTSARSRCSSASTSRAARQHRQRDHVAYVPYLAHDVHDFAALHEVGRLLFDVQSPAR